MKNFKIIILIAILAVVSILLTQKNKILETQKAKVTTSFYPLYDFAKNIGKNMVDVTNITPAGAEPHDFEPTPQDIINIQKSKLFVYNNIGLEKWTDKILPDLGGFVVKATEGIEVVNNDPHVWLDPVLAQKEVENITNALSVADRPNENYYRSNAQIYINKLKALDLDFKSALSNCQARDFITSHEAFGYMSRRYNLNMIAIAGFSPDEEPSPKTLGDLVNFGKFHNIKYIFFESLVSPKLSETLARELNAKTLVLDPIEGLTQERINAGEDYISLQRQNLVNLKIAMNCQ